MASSIRVVCFDLGGVLIRICRSWREGCEVAGLPVRPGIESVLDGSHDWYDINRQYQIDDIPIETYATEVSRITGGLYTAEEIVRIHSVWTRGPYDDVNEIIDGLHDHDIVTAALSNTNAMHWETIGHVDPVARLRHAYASHLLHLHKPDSRIFHEVEERLGVDGDSILFFEDTRENAEAAAMLGWRTHLVDPSRATAPQIREALAGHDLIVGERIEG